MKKLITHQYKMGFLFLALLLVSCGNQNKKNDHKKSDQSHMLEEVGHKSIFENDFSKVLKVSLEPGELIEPHTSEKRLIYSLSDYSIDWNEKGEHLGKQSWKKGDIHYHDAGSHSAKNVGENKAEWLVFIKKNVELPACGDNKLENDVNSISKEFTTVLFDNDEFKITEVSLPKGATIPKHSGINRIIYSISEYEIAFKSSSSSESKKRFQPGEIHWHEACQHTIENIGENEAKFLVISYK